MLHLDLSPIIGSTNTLVITCIECSILDTTYGTGNTYVYTALGATLHDDGFLKETLKYYTDLRKCSQLVVAAHLNCKAFQFLRHDKINSKSLKALKYHLENITNDTHQEFLNVSLRERQLMEANVIAQVNFLLSFDFIREKTNRSALSIVGLIYNEKNQSINTIYKNGMTMNTLVKLN